MVLETIFANMSCSDLSVSEPWYEKLFGRAADMHPMDSLAEWHFTASAALQLYEDKTKAGRSTVALRVAAMEPERDRLAAAGIAVGAIEKGGPGFILRLSDPDANLVVLASAAR